MENSFLIFPSIRLVNLLKCHWTENKNDSIWNTLKEIRKQFLFARADFLFQGQYIGNRLVKKNMDKVENAIKTKYENVSRNCDYFGYSTDVSPDILKTGGKMFTYLNFLPPKVAKFYKELLFQGSIKDIILAVTNIMKTRRNAEKFSATKLWNRIDEKLYLKYKNLEVLGLFKF